MIYTFRLSETVCGQGRDVAIMVKDAKLVHSFDAGMQQYRDQGMPTAVVFLNPRDFLELYCATLFVGRIGQGVIGVPAQGFKVKDVLVRCGVCLQGGLLPLNSADGILLAAIGQLSNFPLEGAVQESAPLNETLH